MLILGTLVLFGCATPPFDPEADVMISSISSGSGGDEIHPNLSLIEGGYFAYDPAVIQFSLNNGVGITLTDLEITYSPSEGDDIVYQDGTGSLQTGIPKKTSKIQRHFNATLPYTELGLSETTNLEDGINQGTGEQRVCCIYINLVTQKASEVLSVDGNFQTNPNYESSIIANLTIRGVDDNDNPFSKEASILVSPIPAQVSGDFDPGCDASCSIGNQPSGGGGTGDTDTGNNAE
jgi:hypothetical protein